MTTGISTYGKALYQIRLLKQQNMTFNDLSVQMSTGLKTQKFSGLNTGALTSQRSRAGIRSIETYQNNIKHADRRIESMLTAIEEFKAQAENFANSLTQLSQQSVHQKGEEILYDDPLTSTEEQTKVGMTSAEPDVDLETVQDLAANIFPLLVDLINARDNSRYIMSGSDSNTKPMHDGGTLDAAMSSLIKEWKDESIAPPAGLTKSEKLIRSITSRTSAEDADAITDTIVGYSASLSAGTVGDIFTRIDDHSEVNYTALANDESFRDVMVAVSYFKNADLGPIADVYAEPYTDGDPTLADGAPGDTLQEMKDNFFEVYNELAGMVNNAIDDIDQVRFNLESARVRLKTADKFHTEEKNALLNTVSDIEYADTNEVALKLQTMQVQLEASYKVTALVSQLSLTNFI